MTQKLYNLDRWVRVEAGKVLPFTLSKPRSVTVEVNAPQETAVSLVDPDGEVHFLALVKGRDRLEFEVRGAFGLVCDQGDVFIYSHDGDAVHSIVEAPESFTRIMTRRQRNPELEAMMATMQANFQRQLDKQAREYGSLIERVAAAAAAQPAPQGAASGSGEEQKPDASAE